MMSSHFVQTAPLPEEDQQFDGLGKVGVGRTWRKRIITAAAVGAAAYFTGGQALKAKPVQKAATKGILSPSAKRSKRLKKLGKVAKQYAQAKMLPREDEEQKRFRLAQAGILPAGGGMRTLAIGAAALVGIYLMSKKLKGARLT